MPVYSVLLSSSLLVSHSADFRFLLGLPSDRSVFIARTLEDPKLRA